VVTLTASTAGGIDFGGWFGSSFGPSTPYRLFNGRTDANHRFTTDLAVRTQMIGKGYVPEGYGPQGVALCALA
jgi:hypothetical protein